jgi:hypothetical protein
VAPSFARNQKSVPFQPFFGAIDANPLDALAGNQFNGFHVVEPVIAEAKMVGRSHVRRGFGVFRPPAGETFLLAEGSIHLSGGDLSSIRCKMSAIDGSSDVLTEVE